PRELDDADVWAWRKRGRQGRYGRASHAPPDAAHTHSPARLIPAAELGALDPLSAPRDEERSMAPSERHGDAPARFPGSTFKADAIQALSRAEAAVCETIFASDVVTSPRSEPRLRSVASASDAIRGAMLEGKRASVVIGAEDVLRSLDALAEAALARA